MIRLKPNQNLSQILEQDLKLSGYTIKVINKSIAGDTTLDGLNRIDIALKENNYDWEDPKLSLGYIKLGQVDLKSSFGETSFQKIYEALKDNLNISKIQVVGNDNFTNDFPYTLDSEDWKQIQIEGLRKGYESCGVR